MMITILFLLFGCIMDSVFGQDCSCTTIEKWQCTDHGDNTYQGGEAGYSQCVTERSDLWDSQIDCKYCYKCVGSGVLGKCECDDVCPYNIVIDIDCNWVYDNMGIQVVGICDTMKPFLSQPDMAVDSQIVCAGTSVSQFIYDSNDGSCSGNVVVESFITDNPTLFDCSMQICGENDYIKFRRYVDCNTSVAVSSYTTYNVVTNQCFHNFGIMKTVWAQTDYFVTCDSSLSGFVYEYDTGDPECSALNPSVQHHDLNTECNGEASYEVLACYGPRSQTNVPNTTATNGPTAPQTTTTVVATGITVANEANPIFEYMFPIITVVFISVFL